MASQGIAAVVLKRHPELKKEFNAKQMRILKQTIEEALALSSRDVLSSKETDRIFKQYVPDTGKASAALRAYRKRLGWTQRKLAEASEIPQPHIAAMESGKRPIGLASAKKLGLALGVDYRKLV